MEVALARRAIHVRPPLILSSLSDTDYRHVRPYRRSLFPTVPLVKDSSSQVPIHLRLLPQASPGSVPSSLPRPFTNTPHRTPQRATLPPLPVPQHPTSDNPIVTPSNHSKPSLSH
jgi:hypothetical protein